MDTWAQELNLLGAKLDTKLFSWLKDEATGPSVGLHENQ